MGSADMQELRLMDQILKGSVSLEITDEYVKPWRIPFNQANLFVPDRINGKAEIPAGVCITFYSNTQSIQIQIVPSDYDIEMDCLIDGLLKHKETIQAGEKTLTFGPLSEKDKRIEIYLSQQVPIQFTGLWIDDNAEFVPSPDSRLRWTAYGSSITQCIQAASPSQTWPALVAQQGCLDLTCLGFGGNCHLEPMVARLIRDIPTDFISLCVGINIMGGSTLSERTFAAGLIGFIQIIREKQPETPIAIISPIYSPNRETTENAVGFTLIKIREEIVNVIKVLQTNGDRNLHYINGLDLFGEEYGSYLPDGLHPNAEGYRIMAQRFEELVNTILPFSQKET